MWPEGVEILEATMQAASPSGPEGLEYSLVPGGSAVGMGRVNPRYYRGSANQESSDIP